MSGPGNYSQSQRPPARRSAPNGIRIARILGINIYLHWSWLIVAAAEIQFRRSTYSSPIWAIAEYLSIFGLVLVHEMGHALACRSTGGRADTIMLWPLGGIAYVQSPRRPGAQLWSIVAGPLVNVIAFFCFWPLLLSDIPAAGANDAWIYGVSLARINLVLLIFNLLPIFPLDGGQILWSLLWFVLGEADSLMVAAVIGIVGGVLLGLAALVLLSDWWLAILAAFAVSRAWMGVKIALAMRQRQREMQGFPVIQPPQAFQTVYRQTAYPHLGHSQAPYPAPPQPPYSAPPQVPYPAPPPPPPSAPPLPGYPEDSSPNL